MDRNNLIGEITNENSLCSDGTIFGIQPKQFKIFQDLYKITCIEHEFDEKEDITLWVSTYNISKERNISFEKSFDYVTSFAKLVDDYEEFYNYNISSLVDEAIYQILYFDHNIDPYETFHFLRNSFLSKDEILKLSSEEFVEYYRNYRKLANAAAMLDFMEDADVNEYCDLIFHTKEELLPQKETMMVDRIEDLVTYYGRSKKFNKNKEKFIEEYVKGFEENFSNYIDGLDKMDQWKKRIEERE